MVQLKKKTLDSYRRSQAAGLGGVGSNDAWNKAKYGISREQHNSIHSILQDMAGIDAGQVTLQELNAVLAGKCVNLYRLSDALWLRINQAFA